MAILTLRYNEKTIREYELVAGQNLSIGRNPDNDIVIDNLGVSGHHARIESVASSFVIRDMDSTNGVFVNKQRIGTHALHHGDMVLIGKHELHFDVFDSLAADHAAREDNDQAAGDAFFEDKTRFLDTSEHRELIRQATEKSANGSSESTNKENKPKGKKGLIAKLLKIIFG